MKEKSNDSKSFYMIFKILGIVTFCIGIILIIFTLKSFILLPIGLVLMLIAVGFVLYGFKPQIKTYNQQTNEYIKSLDTEALKEEAFKPKEEKPVVKENPVVEENKEENKPEPKKYIKFCYECGHEIDDDIKFCPYCGSKQTKEEE